MIHPWHEIFKWAYLLTPVYVSQRIFHNEKVMRRFVYVFGFRVAGWTVG